MSKTSTIYELTNILANALRHRIGSKVNPDQPYANKYEKDAQMHLKMAKKVALREHWNTQDKAIIKEQLQRKLRHELEQRDFIDNKKFDLMGYEIQSVLKGMNLD